MINLPAAGFNDWLAAEVGTHMWVVAPRLSERLRGKGYALAIPVTRYGALMRQHAAHLGAQCILAGRAAAQ